MSGWRGSTTVIYLSPSEEKHRPYFLLPGFRSTSSLVLAAYGAWWVGKVEVAGSRDTVLFPSLFLGQAGRRTRGLPSTSFLHVVCPSYLSGSPRQA